MVAHLSVNFTSGYKLAPGGFGAGPHGGPPRVPCLPT